MKVLIVGAGPAGLGAAEALARAGAEVTVAERQPEPGGTPRLCGHSPFGMREFRRILTGRAYAARLTRAAETAGARILTRASVVALAPGQAEIATPEGLVNLAPDRILLATGAREASRAERLLPGDRPLGVITTGALQDLWFARGIVPFRRPVILGTELVAMSAILTCRQAGARPVAVLETGPASIARAPFRWLPRSLGLPLLTGVEILDLVAEAGRLSRIVIRQGARVEEIACDGLVLTGSFRPESGLARVAGIRIDPFTCGPVVDATGRTSMPGVFAAGNLLRGVETAGACWAEGRAIALSMLEAPQAPGPEIRPGAGLAWVMPQRAGTGALALQARLNQAARGTLRLRDAQGAVLGAWQLASAPERRIALDLGPLALQDRTGPLTLTMEG